MATINEVAEWMVAAVNSSRSLSQTDAAQQIKDTFGEEFTYTNANYNLAINKKVLAAFNKRTKEDVVWVNL